MNKYCVWFPYYPKRAKLFNNLKEARKFLAKQKEEAYLNNNVGMDNEDTIESNKGL